ncbi:hypothetical protein DPMN_152962 [Dreissena polymorpha]|uniref:Uncharacterized protein n=1 Tax=Dreissena polymorpha TaxID=45954 RepID=A0A9D4J5M9_DREPO|nr:hypothetical protein DPMN_152962 [Dreissena polymorpha]
MSMYHCQKLKISTVVEITPKLDNFQIEDTVINTVTYHQKLDNCERTMITV